MPSVFYFLFSIFAFTSGCGAPGEPQPPLPPIPQPIADLSVKQLGDGVLLTFTMPGRSTLGERLAQTPTFEILRGLMRSDATPDAKSFRVVDTVPGALVSRYLQRNGEVQFTDPVPPADAQLRSGQTLVYRVRTLISDRHPSAVSKDATVRLYPVPEAVSSLQANVTEQGVELKWSPATRTSSGEPLPSVKEYHVYRGELDPASAPTLSADRTAAMWKSPLIQLGVTTATDFRDSGFDYDKTYVYVVRSVIDSPAGPLESGDSPEAIVAPKDTFPPAAPLGLVGAVQPGAAPSAPQVELSWSINVEADLVGYRVYRSEKEGDRGALLTPQPLPSPAYRDASVVPGNRYWYSVTAVDRAGNESAPSSVLNIDVAQLAR